jgi:hypothetical protein
VIGALLTFGGAATLSGAGCGFPWTVTATSAAGGNAAVDICGIATGCYPHNRQSVILGNEIRVTYAQAELPDCACIQPTFEFRDTVLIRATPGHYTVTVVVLNCGQPTTVGSTEFTLDASSVIPVLDTRGLAALIALIVFVAIWRLRA